MEDGSFKERGEHKSSRIIRAGRWLANTFHDTRAQLRQADLNPREGMLRSSVAPIEVPDYPPDSDTSA